MHTRLRPRRPVRARDRRGLRRGGAVAPRRGSRGRGSRRIPRRARSGAAGPSAGGRPQDRLRGRVRVPPGRGGGRGGPQGDRAARRCPGIRHPVQEPGGGDSQARSANPRALPGGGRARRAHPPQGHLRRAGAGDGRGLRPPRGQVPAPPPRVRDPDRDAAGGARVGRNGDRRTDDPRGRRARHRPPLRHVRLLRRAGHRARAAEPRPPRRRPREGGPPGRCGRNRRLRVGRVDQRPARRRPPDGGVAAPRAGWSGGRSNGASTRAGTCTRLSCRPGSSPRSASSATVCPSRSTGCCATWTGRTPATSTNRRPPRPSPTTCCGRWSAEPSTRTRCRSPWTGSSASPVGAGHDPRRDQPWSPAAGAPSTAGLCRRAAVGRCDLRRPPVPGRGVAAGPRRPARS